MNKILLKRIVREELKKLKEQHDFDMDEQFLIPVPKPRESERYDYQIDLSTLQPGDRLIGVSHSGKKSGTGTVFKIGNGWVELTDLDLKKIKYSALGGRGSNMPNGNRRFRVGPNGKLNGFEKLEDDSPMSEQAEMKQLPKQHVEALKKMADKLRVRVNVMPGRNNMRLDIITPGDQDATEDVFEKLIKMIEALGYDVDLGRSTRNIDDDGDRLYRPHITFVLAENMKRFGTKNLTEQENNDIPKQISSKLINKTIDFIHKDPAKAETNSPQKVQYKIISYEDRDFAADVRNTKTKEIVFFAKHVGTNYPGGIGNSAPHQGFIFLPIAYDDSGKYFIPRNRDIKMYATAANKTNADFKTPYIMKLAKPLMV